MIRQYPMKPGSWNITLSRDTPERILDRCRLRKSDTNFAGFSTLLVLESHVDPSVGVAALLSQSVYSGVYRTRRNGYELSGAGLEIYLGDEDGIGPTTAGNTTKTFAGWVQDARLLNGFAGEYITAGTVSAIGGTWYWEQGRYVASRDLLNAVCEHFGMEWRINPDLTLDADTITNLYGTDPVAYYFPNATTGPGPVILTGTADYTETVEEFAHILNLTSSVSDFAGTALHPAAPAWCTPYNFEAVAADRKIFRARLVSTGGDETIGTIDDRAAATLGTEFCKATISLTVDNYRPSLALPGKFIGVYDPRIDLYDTTADQIWLGGELCTPLTTRVMGVEWDLPTNAGVYLVDSNGANAFTSRTVTDLSQWVVKTPTPRAKVSCGALEPTWATAVRRKYDTLFGG